MATQVVKLKSSDGEIFEVDEAVAWESRTLKNLIEDVGTEGVIPLPNVSSKTLATVIQYCKFHAAQEKCTEGNPAASGDFSRAWDAKFVKTDEESIFHLVLAANYLDIPKLLDLTCQAVADMIKGKTPEEIRQTFHIQNDFTKEEEEEVRRANKWAFP